MKIKKLLALLLAIVMVTAFVAACADDPAPVEQVRDNTLIVGHNHALGENFVGGFNNAAVNLDFIGLMLAHSLVYIEDDGVITINPTAVAGTPEISDDAAGNRTYVWTINSGLVWSDGREITAHDYVANVLWRASDFWSGDAGAWADTAAYQQLLGWQAYNEGETEYFAAAQVIDNHTFSLTISADELPYFWETSVVTSTPIPLHIWAPEVEVISNENGARFSEDVTDRMLYVAENQVAMLGVTSGAYTFVSWADEIATLARNPRFSGDPWGRVPTIEYIQVVNVPSAVDVDNLFAGDVDLLPAFLTASKIERVMANSDFAVHGYIRAGFGVINFQHYAHEGQPHPGQDVLVRRALAHVLDRQSLLDHVLGGFGSLIDTMASPAVWAWQAIQSQALEQMIEFTFSVDQANYWLDQSQWRFEADGTTPWDADQATTDSTYIRHNSDGEPLIFRMSGGAPDVLEGVNLATIAPASMAGINFIAEDTDFMAVIIPSLDAPWDLDEITHYAFAMGFGFLPVIDPYWSFHSDLLGTWNNPAFSDPVMDEIMVRMRRTEPDDVAGFLEAYLDFVIRYNYMLPTLPLYNNIWHDMYNPRIQGMSAINDWNGWAQHIAALSFAE